MITRGNTLINAVVNLNLNNKHLFFPDNYQLKLGKLSVAPYR